MGGLQPQKKIGMIDEMVAVLKEQKDDDSKEEYCEKSLDQTHDRKKGPGAVYLQTWWRPWSQG